MELFVGINVEHVGKFRVDVRRSKVEYYDKVLEVEGLRFKVVWEWNINNTIRLN